MPEPVYLPKVGMTMEEGTLVRWLLPDGAEVKSGEPIFELETEKVEMDVEAEADGILRQLVPEDTKLKPGDVVGCILAAGEDVPAALLERVRSQSEEDGGSEAPVAPGPSIATPGGEARLRVTPIARRLAVESGIDLATIKGTGPEGRITEQDVRQAIESRSASPPAHRQVASLASQPSGGGAPYRGRRRTIGERMAESLRAMAQVTLSTEAPVGDAMKMIHGLNREWRRDGVALTLTALVVKACGLALREHPRFNAVLEGDRIVFKAQINVGLAVDVEEGLIVPVVRAADSRPLRDIANAVRDLVDQAKDGRVLLDDLAGGTMTATSLESSVVDAFTPIINPPQVAIVGIGRVRDVVAFEGAEVVRRQVTTLSLTFDHRVNDGAPAALFLGRIAELLARPYMLM
jgi:pyruvate dehydrogenase E2 component (dihydrolipoamide acetyltransferase)